MNRKSVLLSDKQSERQINGQTDEQKEGRRYGQADRRPRTNGKWTKSKDRQTWAFIYSTFLGLIVVRTTAFSTRGGRWVCAGTKTLSLASATDSVTPRPQAPAAPTAIH